MINPEVPQNPSSPSQPSKPPIDKTNWLKKKKFQAKKEDFICEKCGFDVKGNGFTNHCPKCLWSKHVDKNPGDREEKCGGLMKPVSVEGTQAAYSLHYICEKCGYKNKNKVAASDDFDAVLKIAGAKKPGQQGE